MKAVFSRWIIAIGLLLVSTLPALAEDDSDARIIKVSGEAEVKVVPDRVVIMVGVEKVDSVMNVAKKQSEAVVKAVMAAATKNGVMKKDISTEFFDVKPTYDTHDNFIGYQVRKRIAITLNDITKYEALMSDLLDSGIINVQNVQFQTSELRKYRDQARSNAIKAAREKAQALATDLGLKVGKAHSISEGYSRWYSWYGGWYDYGYGGRHMSQNVIQNAPSSPSDENPIAFGTISVTASVSASFDLE